MSIKDKSTYGDYYWASQVEASQAFDEVFEENLKGQVGQIVRDFKLKENLPPEFADLLDPLLNPPTAGYGMVLGRFVSEAADSILGQSMNHALRDFNYKMAEWFSDLRLDFDQASLLYQRKVITDELYKARMVSQGYKPEEGAFAYMTKLPYPSVPDIMLFSRYHSDPDNIRSKVWEWFDVPVRDFELWEWLAQQRLTTEQVQDLFRRGDLSESDALYELSRIGWRPEDRFLVKNLTYDIPIAMLLVQGDLQQSKSSEEILQDIVKGKVHPDYAQTYLDAILTKPSSQDVINFALRQDPGLSDLGSRLRKIGIHSDYHELYKELAYQIPPVPDLITMAVREAFTPEIAQRFGQYQDFPEEFETWAEKKGLSSDWAKRYWASHWSLPSTQQGFEMLHRGVINEADLNTLLRALDIMPFWRDKLTKIAFRRLTRVDVRRMYRTGVMTEQEVYQAYLEQGYNERDAERMTKFTVRQTLDTQAKFTSRDVVAAYAKRMIDRGEASYLMRELGVRSENIDYILTTADYKRHWAYVEEKISGIKNLYKKQVYDDNQARDKLSALDLPGEQIAVLMEQWFFEVKAEPVRHWTTAQTLSFIEKGLISRERGIKELREIGYDSEHINIYMEASK